MKRFSFRKMIVFIANRIWVIAVIYLASILLASWIFSHCENRSYWDGLWWSCVTALTIGYGDLAPASSAGRIAGVIFGHFWIFGMIPLIVGNIISQVLQDKNRFTHEEQEWQEKALLKIAEKVGVTLDKSPSDY